MPRVSFQAAHRTSGDKPGAGIVARREGGRLAGERGNLSALFVFFFGQNSGRPDAVQVRAANPQPGELRKTLAGASRGSDRSSGDGSFSLPPGDEAIDRGVLSKRMGRECDALGGTHCDVYGG